MNNCIQTRGPGDFLGKLQTDVYNRTGGTLTNGELVGFNLVVTADEVAGSVMAGVDPDVQNTDGASDYILGGVAVPTVANMRYIVGVVDDPRGSFADNTVGRITLRGIVLVKTTDANKGEFVTGGVGKTSIPLTKAEVIALTTEPVKLLGYHMQPVTGTGTGLCIFDGINGFSLVGGDT